jgi:hypothetical protein
MPNKQPNLSSWDSSLVLSRPPLFPLPRINAFFQRAHNILPQTAIALLNDSWEMVSNVDTTGNFVPLSPPRAVLHDLFSLAVCMGGLMLLLFSDLRDQNVSQMVVFSNYRIRAEEIEAGRTIWNTKHEMFRAAQGFVAAVAYVVISCPIRYRVTLDRLTIGHDKQGLSISVLRLGCLQLF